MSEDYCNLVGSKFWTQARGGGPHARSPHTTNGLTHWSSQADQRSLNLSQYINIFNLETFSLSSLNDIIYYGYKTQCLKKYMVYRHLWTNEYLYVVDLVATSAKLFQKKSVMFLKGKNEHAHFKVWKFKQTHIGEKGNCL